MPWREASCATTDASFTRGSNPSAGLQNLFACSRGDVDGWSSVGNVAALSALLLALATAGAFVWPRFRARLPALSLGLVLVYLAVAVAAQTRLEAHQDARQLRIATGGTGGVHYHISYGTYVGLAAAALALLGAGFAGPSSWSARPPFRRLCGSALAAGLLVALLLPWERAGLPPSVRISELGIAAPSGAIASVAALGLLVVSWARIGTGALELAGLALGALFFAGAAFTVGFGGVHAYGSWVGIGFAAVAAPVFLADRSLLQWIERPSAYVAATAIAGATVLASLFLPWQTACYGNTADLKSLGIAGRCVSANGLGLAGSTAAVLTIALVVAVTILPPVRRALWLLELATGLGLLVVTLGFRLETGTQSGVRLGFGDGAIIGFLAAATLIALALAPSKWRRLNLKAAAPCLLPISLGVVYVAAVIVPWWDVLPHEVWSTFIPRFAALSWLTLAGALLGIRLVHVWIRQASGADHGSELVLLSLALVVLAVLDAVPLPTVQLNWNSGVLFGLTVPLMLFAFIEERGGLRNLQVPEILRVDRV
jgi:hypothetical protein